MALFLIDCSYVDTFFEIRHTLVNDNGSFINTTRKRFLAALRFFTKLMEKFIFGDGIKKVNNLCCLRYIIAVFYKSSEHQLNGRDTRGACEKIYAILWL